MVWWDVLKWRCIVLLAPFGMRHSFERTFEIFSNIRRVKGIIDAIFAFKLLLVVVMTQRKIQTGFCHMVRIERLADDHVVIDGLADFDIAINSHNLFTPQNIRFNTSE